eukprot:gb/GEZN01013940.1/.p1 GENE.gb/GEZN01013940.1/~~gb/GEZN01013940.1/.p1  ORF type:complete len:318 (+),score=58.71 gb/GEZN01013940.1/:98-955(+)
MGVPVGVQVPQAHQAAAPAQRPIQGLPVVGQQPVMGVPVNQQVGGYRPPGGGHRSAAAQELADQEWREARGENVNRLAKTSKVCFWLGVIVILVGMFELVLNVIPMMKGEGASTESHVLSLLNIILLIVIGLAGVYAGSKQDLWSAKCFVGAVLAYLIAAIVLWILQMISLGKWDCVASVHEEVTCSDFSMEDTCMEKAPICQWEDVNVCADQAEEFCATLIKFQRMLLLMMAMCTLCYVACCYRTARDHQRAVWSSYNDERAIEEALAIRATQPNQHDFEIQHI